MSDKTRAEELGEWRAELLKKLSNAEGHLQAIRTRRDTLAMQIQKGSSSDEVSREHLRLCVDAQGCEAAIQGINDLLKALEGK